MGKIKEKFKEMFDFTPKTNQREVFDWIIKYRGLSKELPRGRLISRIFGISAERGSQYLKMFKKKMDKINNN